MQLGDIPAFNGLNQTQIDNFASAADPFAADAGEKLLERGATASRVFFLANGQLRIHVASGSRDEELASVAAPCVVGELELLAGGEHAATVTATNPCSGIVMSYDTFRQRLDDGDPATLRVVYNLSKVLARRLAAMDDRVVKLLSQPDPRHGDLQALRAKLFGEWSV